MSLKRISIYKINNNDCDYIFNSYDEKYDIKKEDYELKFSDYLSIDDDESTLEDVYETFNLNGNLLERNRMRSLSVSDVVVVNGEAYYCDAIGWKKLNNF